MQRKKNFVKVDNASDRQDYVALLKKIEKENVCPFCMEYFLKNNPMPILRNGAHWVVTPNVSPYKGTEHHFIFVHKKHIERPEQLKPAAWEELRSHVAWLSKKYKMPGGGFFMRFGEGSFSGATVAHLHAHLLTGKKKSASTLPIKPTLGYGENK